MDGWLGFNGILSTQAESNRKLISNSQRNATQRYIHTSTKHYITLLTQTNKLSPVYDSNRQESSISPVCWKHHHLLLAEYWTSMTSTKSHQEQIAIRWSVLCTLWPKKTWQ